VSVAFLDDMAGASRERVRAAKQTRSEAALELEARQSPAPPRLRLDASGFDLIAELKLRSPAAGQLGAPSENVAARVTAYAQAGAAAISVLTEPSRFDGSLDHLASATRALAPLAVPAMRKDFLVDPYQVLEARAAARAGCWSLCACCRGARSMRCSIALVRSHCSCCWKPSTRATSSSCGS